MTETDTVVKQFSALSTPTISDALDRLGIPGQALGIKAVADGLSLAGRAHTLSYAPTEPGVGTVGDYIDDIAPGDIVTIDNQGCLDATVWGDILTLVAHKRGVGGTVIDGICRDTDRARVLSYPVFARGNWMRTGKDRVRLVATQIDIQLGGITVSPGDILVGDSDGIVVVPKNRESEVLDVALGIEAAEERIRAAVSEGMRLDEARRTHGYHQLQRRS